MEHKHSNVHGFKQTGSDKLRRKPHNQFEETENKKQKTNKNNNNKFKNYQNKQRRLREEIPDQ